MLKEEEVEEAMLIVDDEERLDDKLTVLNVAEDADLADVTDVDDPVELVDPELGDGDGFETNSLDEALFVVLLSVVK